MNFKNKFLLISSFLISFIVIFFNNYLLNLRTDFIDSFSKEKLNTILQIEDILKIENEFISYTYSTFIISLTVVLLMLLLLNFLYVKTAFNIDKYITILNKITDNIFVIDINSQKIVFLNETAKKVLGYEKNEIKELNLNNLLIPFSQEEEIDIEKLEINNLENNNFIIKAFLKTKDENKIPVEISFSQVENKRKPYVVAVCLDLTKRLDLEIRESANKKMIDEHIPISQTNLQGVITYVNEAFCKLTGYNKDELIGKMHNILKHPDTNKEIYKKLWEDISQDKTWVGVLKNKIKNNKTIWSEIKINPVFDYMGNKIGYISTREDISYKKELEYLSEHDILTNIKNRRTYEKELKKEISLANRYENHHFGLIMFDIDYFKKINDTFGHHEGDKILSILCENISSNLRDNDTFARWGGEEFVILCPYTNIKQLELISKNLQEMIKEIDFSPISNITISLGITVYQKDDTEISIQKRADNALYDAKRNGRNQYQISL